MRAPRQKQSEGGGTENVFAKLHAAGEKEHKCGAPIMNILPKKRFVYN